MTEIIPGIYQLKVPIPNNPLEYTNVYLVWGNDGHLLIDTGVNTPEAFQSLKKQLAEIGVDFQGISQIVVTHVHGDHYGLADKIRALSQAKLAFHDKEKSLIYPEFGTVVEMFHQIDQMLRSNGMPARELAGPGLSSDGMQRFSPPTPPDITFDDQETISTGVFDLQVIWTPGHSPGHICLYQPTQKLLFSGDHILPVITPNISLRPQSSPNPLGEFIQSLRKVEQLDVKLVLPAHEQIFTDLPKRVKEIIDHHKRRSGEIMATIRTGPKTAYEISMEVTWMPELGGVPFMELAPWDRRSAVSETLAHLESMRADGKIETVHKNSITYYQRI
jgi:glyoxylase-like metal-dependent hydrolase (beta-lactamase superfamily II)